MNYLFGLHLSRPVVPHGFRPTARKSERTSSPRAAPTRREARRPFRVRRIGARQPAVAQQQLVGHAAPGAGRFAEPVAIYLLLGVSLPSGQATKVGNQKKRKEKTTTSCTTLVAPSHPVHYF